ncbi:MAG: OB-fold nucleic acid binding domain-containing protein, partial [candidate division WOR-3 bacterium]
MKNQFVKDLTIGTKVNDIFYLINRWQFDKRSGGKFLVLELADRSGIIKGKIWDNVEVLYSACSPGNFVKVVGDVTEYNDEIQITIADIKAVPEKEVSLKDFIASSRFDLNEMYQELIGYIEMVTDADYQRLLKSAFANQDLVMKFKLAPASAGIHHAYIGGLLEHTLFMLRLARQVPVVYPELDYSLVITGIIFHDIGKIREYQYDKVISHTDE